MECSVFEQCESATCYRVSAGEAKSLLFAAALGTIHGGNNIRKIKPLTEEVQSDATPSEKQLQVKRRQAQTSLNGVSLCFALTETEA